MSSEDNTKRTKPWGLKVHENFFWKVKQTALEERCEVVELVERVLSDYIETKHSHTHTHTHTKYKTENKVNNLERRLV